MKIITYLQLEQVKGISPRSTLKQLVKKGIKTNFETKVTPHTLRHSFAIYLLNHVKKTNKENTNTIRHTNSYQQHKYTAKSMIKQ